MVWPTKSLCSNSVYDTFGTLWRLLTDFKGIIWWKKILGCVYKPSSNNLKIWKFSYLKKNLGVGIVVDYADMQFSNFVSEYLWENKKVRETVFACSNGTQIESFKPKKWSKISCHCPFKHASFFYLWESVQQNCCNISTKGVAVQVSTIVGHRYF